MDKQNQNQNQQEENDKKVRFKVNLNLLLAVLAIFGIMMFFTGLIGEYLGTAAENIVLSAVAVVLAVMLWQTNKKK